MDGISSWGKPDPAWVVKDWGDEWVGTLWLGGQWGDGPGLWGAELALQKLPLPKLEPCLGTGVHSSLLLPFSS